MGKKSINEVLAHGKALNRAVKKSRESTGSEEVPEYPVPLNSKLPGGLTLKGFMKKQGVSYEEACRIYHAYQDHAAEEEDKLSKRKAAHGDRPVATPARGVPKAKGKSKATSKSEKTPDATPAPAEPEPAETPETSNPKKKRSPKGKEVEEEVEAPEPSKGNKKKKADGTEPAEKPPKKRSKAKEAEEADEPTEPAQKPANKRSKAKEAEEASASPAEPKPAAGSSCKCELSFASAFSSEEECEPDATPEGEPDLDGEPLEDGDVEAASKYKSPKKFRRIHEKRALTMSESKAITNGASDGKGCEPPKILNPEEPATENSKVKRKNADIFETPESAKKIEPPPKRAWCLDYFNNIMYCMVLAFISGPIILCWCL